MCWDGERMEKFDVKGSEGNEGRALHPREKPVVGWLAGATRAFVLAGRFVGIYPTPVSIFAGAGSLHGSGMCTLHYVKIRT